jgi:RNA polymerase sigma factor for flagellar operon FliA
MATSPVVEIADSMFAGLLSGPAWMPPPPREKKTSAATAAAMARTPWGEETREQILLETLPVVRYVAHRIHARLPQSVEFDDLVSAGVVGLIDAYNKFDAGKNILFRTYASLRIRGAILDSLRELDLGPRELRRKARDMEEAKQRLMQRLGRRPEQSEVANEMGMALTSYQELLITVKGLEIGSLQETRRDDSAEEEICTLEADAEDDPLHRYMRSERAAHLSAAVAELPEREQRVLQMYYVEEMTMKEIGMVLRLVESRVSQIRSAAVEELRARMAGDVRFEQA